MKDKRETDLIYSEIKNLLIDEKTDEFIEAMKSIERGVDIPCETYDMFLNVAAHSNDETACKFLINQGADPTYALENVFNRDEVDSVQTLINSGVEMDGDIFRYATRNGHIHLAEQILSKGFDIDHDDSYGLKYSTHYNQQAMSKFLIENGATANHSEILTNAVANNDLFTTRTSLEHGADVHQNSEAPLVKACSNNSPGIINILIEHGANPNANDDEPLRIASKFGAKDSVSSLVMDNRMNASTITRDWLKVNGYDDTLRLLEKRDLYAKLDNNLNTKPSNSQQTKIKQSHARKL